MSKREALTMLTCDYSHLVIHSDKVSVAVYLPCVNLQVIDNILGRKFPNLSGFCNILSCVMDLRRGQGSKQVV